MTEVRHPEKIFRVSNPIPKKPSWIRVKAPTSKFFKSTNKILKDKKIVTVCEEAACPNISECWQKKHATFMILGDICTRACAFCNIKTGKPGFVDESEPKKIAEAVSELALDILSNDLPDVFNHNLETVPRLYLSIRPGSRYFVSLKLLADIKKLSPKIFTKSGLMVGLGETKDEIYQVMDDLRAADVDFITIGQYLPPTPKHAKLEKFITPKEFEEYKQMAIAKGFLMVSSSPLTRSSYHASEDFRVMQENRASKNY